MSHQPCIYIVDDDYAVRDGLGLIIESAGLTYRTFGNAEDFLEAYKDGYTGCLLLDINMPGMKGHELQAELIRRNSQLPIIFLTAFGDIPMTVRAMKAGAVDFLTKPVPKKKLLDCIELALKQAADKQQHAIAAQAFRNLLNMLTSREMEVLPLALEGISNKEIAQRLKISYRTVEIHRINILQKTGSTNFLELGRQCEAYKISLLSGTQN